MVRVPVAGRGRTTPPALVALVNTLSLHCRRCGAKLLHSPCRTLRITRIFVVAVGQVFFLSTLNFMLVPIAIDWWGMMLPRYGVPHEEARMKLLYFPGDLTPVQALPALLGGIFAVLQIAVGFIGVRSRSRRRSLPSVLALSRSA